MARRLRRCSVGEAVYPPAMDVDYPPQAQEFRSRVKAFLGEHLPPGWPDAVRPPGVSEWEQTATAWLLDLCPSEYRRWPGLRRHLVVLARFAALHVEAQQAATRRGLADIRNDLRAVVTQAVVEAAVQTFQIEDARLLVVRRAVGLVEEALRGRRYVPRL